MSSKTPRLFAYVGTYTGSADGGIHILKVSKDGRELSSTGHASQPKESGYLAYAASTGTLYAVNERKTDGRGPVEAPAAVHSFTVNQQDGSLTPLGSRPAPGPFPTFLSVSDDQRRLISANHGSFEHVEHVVKGRDGEWTVEYLYDDSSVLVYDLGTDGAIGKLTDVKVIEGHGKDPNFSPQAGGHAQASPHAHCAVIDPSGRYLLVADKGTDRIYVYTLGATLELAFTHQCAPETGPRHIAFDPVSGNAYVTLEFASKLAAFAFDPRSGELALLDEVTSTESGHTGLNEPAEVRVHPDGDIVYVNNRGEDSLAWFSVSEAGKLTRQGHTDLAPSLHPGVAARNFSIDPTGSFLLVADRPAALVRSYAIDNETGALTPLTEISIPEPAFVQFVELTG
ncbi:lactonase family protein [Paenarthrobacter sp. TYUT067]|uniref:lactonase family protein n=1 Tax=Paenarthrobacter sp. TYUT067 TaxID=2926245 RepID=UPI00202EC9D3|nr:lactonase family protein [Paenarthrobacter sp. TYUT067]MCM0614983.1 lactonase family protein [Paenarthrobacter sp. TYUT067]